MFNISGLLESFKKQIHSEDISCKEICEVITKQTGIPCDPEKIEIKNYVLYVHMSPTYKNKIVMKKKEIIEDLAKISATKIINLK